MNNFTLDRKKKVFVKETGEEIPVPKDMEKAIFRTKGGKNLYQKKLEVERESKPSTAIGQFIDKAVHENYLANLGRTGFDYLESAGRSFSPSEGQENLGFVDRVLDNFYAIQDARKAAHKESEEEFPIASKIGSAGKFVTDVLSSSNLPGAAVIPLMGAAESEKSILDEPAEYLKERGVEAVEGFTLDKLFKYLGKIGQARKSKKAIEKEIPLVQAENQAAIEARAQQVAALPAQQQAAQQAHSAQALQRTEKMINSLGNTNPRAEALGIEEFIDTSISRTALNGTKEGKRAETLLTSLFKPNKEGKLTPDQIKRGFQGLEDAISKESPEVADILVQYKNHALQTFPESLSSAFIEEKYVPRIISKATKGIEKDVDRLIASNQEIFDHLEYDIGKGMSKRISTEVDQVIAEEVKNSGNNLVNDISSGELSQRIHERFKDLPIFQDVKQLLSNYPFTKTRNQSLRDNARKVRQSKIYKLQSIENELDELPNQLYNNFEKSINKELPDILKDYSSKRSVIDSSLQKAQGKAAPLPEPPPPQLAEVPAVPPAENVLEKLGYGLNELNMKNILGSLKTTPSKIGAGTSLATGLGVLKYLGFPVAKPVAAGLGAVQGLKAATSEPALNLLRRAPYHGRELRAGLEQVEQMAARMPSFNPTTAVVVNPAERQIIAQQIENMPLTNLEKADLQTKIRRGIPLWD